MSIKRIGGWEPATETVYEYDEDGRLARAVTRTEPEWDSDDRTMALALLDYEADRCPGCGGQMRETTAPDSAGRWDAGLPHRCHACTALSVAQAPYQQVQHAQALLWPTPTRKT